MNQTIEKITISSSKLDVSNLAHKLLHLPLLLSIISSLQSKDNSLEDLKQHIPGTKLNPVQLAAFLECSDSLNVLLRYIQGKCSKDSEGELREKTMKIMHVSAFEKNLMSVVLGNKNLFACHSICHQIESYLHESDQNSIGVKKCIHRNLGSSKLSKNTVSAIKKLYPKELSLFQKTKMAFYTFFYTLYKAFPIVSDVVTDSLLVKKYYLQNHGGFLFLEFPLHNFCQLSQNIKLDCINSKHTLLNKNV